MLKFPELTKSLETYDFVLVLMRFLNRRGHVKEIRSDNGTNFFGTQREKENVFEERGPQQGGTRANLQRQ